MTNQDIVFWTFIAVLSLMPLFCFSRALWLFWQIRKPQQLRHEDITVVSIEIKIKPEIMSRAFDEIEKFANKEAK